jgi:hypothetical protein
LGVTLWGLFARQRSAVVGAIAVGVAVLATIGAWYAWAESNSMPWTVSYGVLAVASLAAATRQFVGSGKTSK